MSPELQRSLVFYHSHVPSVSQSPVSNTPPPKPPLPPRLGRAWLRARGGTDTQVTENRAGAVCLRQRNTAAKEEARGTP